ncbi:protease IV [Apostasia shenzhenica]|uniref:Protease IV n=1 Tax=Apostasia shenzhenica TaxID=1088818 RepID=A0A2I0BDH9_9ASPA|nr:protease IV [Apostasia shenzhenica]
MSKILLLKPSDGLQGLKCSRRFSSIVPIFHSATLPVSSSTYPILPATPRTALRDAVPSLRRFLPVRAAESSLTEAGEQAAPPGEKGFEDVGLPSAASSSAFKDESATEAEYPTGDFRMEEFGWWMRVMVKLRMLFAFPWERVKKGSVLTMKLRGRITDQLISRFSSGLSLPKICENFIKTAYDPRISGIYLHIEPISCGWGKLEEIRRHILNFKKSGLGPLHFRFCGLHAPIQPEELRLKSTSLL